MEAEDESCQIAFGNLRSEVITLRNEGLEKDKTLFSLVHRLKLVKPNLVHKPKLIKSKLKI
jgi:hypothetical protein